MSKISRIELISNPLIMLDDVPLEQSEATIVELENIIDHIENNPNEEVLYILTNTPEHMEPGDELIDGYHARMVQALENSNQKYIVGENLGYKEFKDIVENVGVDNFEKNVSVVGYGHGGDEALLGDLIGLSMARFEQTHVRAPMYVITSNTSWDKSFKEPYDGFFDFGYEAPVVSFFDIDSDDLDGLDLSSDELKTSGRVIIHLAHCEGIYSLYTEEDVQKFACYSIPEMVNAPEFGTKLDSDHVAFCKGCAHDFVDFAAQYGLEIPAVYQPGMLDIWEGTGELDENYIKRIFED